LVVASTTQVANLNAATLGGATFAAPGAIGGTTPGSGAFTTITGTSSATLGANGGTGGSLVINGSTSGSATINASATGVLALPSGTTATSMALTTPNIGAATGTSLLATGIVDGSAPVTITTSGCVTGTHCGLGATYHSGYTWNNYGTAATTSFYDLPAVASTVAGMQYCVTNGYGAAGAVTGAISVTPLTTAAIVIKGVVGTANHAAVSGGAAGDSACFVAVDTTHWIAYVQSGTWTTP
jgi:hypothetical protein